jgi:hypothetical protein
MVRKLSLSLAIAGLIAQLIISGCAAGTASPGASKKTTAKPATKPPSSLPARPEKASRKAKSGTTTKASSSSSATDKKPRAQVLDPNQFFGMAMIGYAAAKAAPEVMENLFCYCGCDLTDSHISLLDCFTSIHGVDCSICQEEAQIALKLHKQGMPMPKIQRRIDEEFARQYPFEEDTPTYTKYKAKRLWIKSDAKSGGTKAESAPKSEPAATTGSGSDPKKPKLKPGAKAGNCCGGKHQAEKQK